MIKMVGARIRSAYAAPGSFKTFTAKKFAPKKVRRNAIPPEIREKNRELCKIR